MAEEKFTHARNRNDIRLSKTTISINKEEFDASDGRKNSTMRQKTRDQTDLNGLLATPSNVVTGLTKFVPSLVIQKLV